MFDWIVEWVEAGGYAGIALLMFLENVFPPIPSELIMPLAGFSAHQGGMNIGGVIAAGTVGSVAGALFWYWIGLWLGRGRIEPAIERFGRVLTMSLDDLDTAKTWFRWHAAKAVFFGRLIPTVRTLISVPAGIASMAIVPFMMWSSLGTALWTSLLAVAGYMLGSQYELVEGWIDPVSKLIVVAIVVIYLWRLITYKPGRKAVSE